MPTASLITTMVRAIMTRTSNMKDNHKKQLLMGKRPTTTTSTFTLNVF